jgi:hypothetical protein
MEFYTGHFVLSSSLLDDSGGRLSPLGPHPPLQLWQWVLRLAVGCHQLLLLLLVVVVATALGLSPGVGLALPLHRLGDWGVPGVALCSLGIPILQAKERRDILDVMGGKLLQHLLICYSLVKYNHHRSIGDTRNGIANRGEPLDEGAQRFLGVAGWRGGRSRCPTEHKRSRSWP